MLQELIQSIATLPGLGPRSAKRILLHLMKNDAKLMKSLCTQLDKVSNNIKNCNICGNIDASNPCEICSSQNRDKTKLCIVEEVSGLWNIENTGHYNGMYHVLGGVILANRNILPENLSINELLLRIQHNPDIEEIILANSPTVAGQTTSFYVIDCVEKLATEKNLKLHITTLGRGLPIGSDIDYLDESTILAAFKARRKSV